MANIPAIVVAATGSGVGKTSLTLGLARALARRGLRVQTFKVGPDFLDPSYHALASGRPCYNLDGWMTSQEYVCRLFARVAAEADVVLVEGVMGLFDGASPSGLEGSTAQIALWLDAPVLLIVHAHGAARSLAASVYGFTHFEPGVRLAGVIANHGGSPRHARLIAESLRAAGLPPLVGLVPRDGLPKLASRHLGLVTAEHGGLSSATIDHLADACEKHIDLDQVMSLAKERRVGPDCLPSPSPSPPTPLRAPRSGRGEGDGPPLIRIGLAYDAAFHFYYPDNLEALEHGGAEIVRFSPLTDAALPADLDALYFGGGYPELYAQQLASNASLLQDLRDFAAAGRTIYAECGGLMYLGRSLTARDGRRHSLVGLLPVDTQMLPRLSMLGYTEAALAVDGLWGLAGTVCRGHEFHYSTITADDGAATGWQPAYWVSRRAGGSCEPAGLTRGRILASYLHLHWAARPELVDHFLKYCQEPICTK